MTRPDPEDIRPTSEEYALKGKVLSKDLVTGSYRYVLSDQEGNVCDTGSVPFSAERV